MKIIDPKPSVFFQFLGFLNTPPLWETTVYFKFPSYEMNLMTPPSTLGEDLNIPPKLVLGKRIEHFFEYYLRSASKEHLLAKNSVIRSGKITIGELDFLMKNETTKVISHVEVIYKFYLYDPDIPQEVQRWIGPNKKDSLLNKLEKLEEKQFPLLFREETKPLLQKLGCSPEEIIQKVCFKANLFVPFCWQDRQLPLINNKCIQGYWIRANQFSEKEYGAFSFFTPDKRNWPVEPKHGKIWYTFTEIEEQISALLNKQKSPLVWMKSGDSQYFRFFIVWW